MAVDYSKLSDRDLVALSKRDYASMSDAGLAAVGGAGVIDRRQTPRTGLDSIPAAGVPTGTASPADASVARLAADRKRFEGVANDIPWLERQAAAAGGAIVGMKHGLQSLGHDIVPGMVDAPNPEDVEMQKSLAKVAPLGDIAGQLSTLAIPGPGMAAGAAKLLGRAGPTIAKYGAMPLAAGIQGGTLTAPSEDESRLGNLGTAAAFGSALQQVGRGLSRTLTGLVRPNLTEEAKTIIRAGTTGLGQGESRLIPTVAGATEGGLGTIVGGAQKIVDLLGGKSKRFSSEVIDQAVRESVPYPSKMVAKPGSTQKWAAEGQEQYDKAYAGLLKTESVPLRPAHRDALMSDAQNWLAGKHPQGPKNPVGTPQEQGKISWAVESAWNRAEQKNKKFQGSSAQFYQEVRNELSAEKRNLKGDSADVMGEALENAIRRLDNFAEAHLGPDVMMGLATLHQRNVGFHVMKEAIEKTKSSLPLTLQEFTNTVQKEAPAGLSMNAEGKFQSLTKPAQTILDRENLMGTFPKRAAYLGAGALTMGLPLLSGMGLLGLPVAAGALAAGALAKSRSGAKFLMGLNSQQEKLAELLRKTPGIANAQARIAASPEHQYIGE